MTTRLKLKAQLFLGEEIAFGPGKAQLLEAIIDAGSISAAARALGLSYRRAWMMVDMMNRCFAKPLVSTAAGGKQGGGAAVTDEGEAVLALYRAMQASLESAAGPHQQQLAARLRP